MPDNKYVIISPGRNEAQYMRQTLDSVSRQTILPARWIIVDDGSTDDTPVILSEYQKKYPFIEIVTRNNRGHRSVGPGVIDTFYEGYALINPSDYNYICKLDLDLRLPQGYFEELIKRMEHNPKLACCSGKAYIEKNGELIGERLADDVSIGASKFYRMSCFLEIGGFIRQVMWDGIDCHLCRMKGWVARSWDDPEIRFIHLRPMGSSHKGILTGRVRHGKGQYFMGTGFVFLMASALTRLNHRPYVVGTLAIIWGWIYGLISRMPRYEYPGFRNYLRKYQKDCLFYGKNKVLEKIHGKYWSLK